MYVCIPPHFFNTSHRLQTNIPPEDVLHTPCHFVLFKTTRLRRAYLKRRFNIYLYLMKYFKALRPCRRSVSILDPITELKSMAMVSEKRSEEKRSEEKKRKEKTRYWLHAHGAGNFTQLLWLFPQGFHTHTKNEIILGTFFDMFGVLLASLSNETLDFEKHHCKTHDFGEKKRARSEKRRPWKEKASPNWEKDPSRKKKQK